MRLPLLLLSLAVLTSGAEASAQLQQSGPDYAADASWLCLPGRKDACAASLATTELGPGGYGARTASTPAAALWAGLTLLATAAAVRIALD